MTMEAWTLILVMFTLSFSSVFAFLWAKKDGQFDDVEAIKYRMLDDEQEGF